MKILHILLPIFFAFTLLPKTNSQETFSPNQLEDFSTQAQNQIINFFLTVEQLGSNQLPQTQIERAIKSVVKTFTFEGTVEERSKGAVSGVTKLVRSYLERISARGQKTPVLISYDIIDLGSWKELKPYSDSNSNVLLKCTMKVRQYYCKLKPKDQLSDKLSENCSYSDTTDK